MTKISHRTIVEIAIAGKNVTKDLAPYLLEVTFNDKTNSEVDDITIRLDDRDELFSGDCACGSFEIDLITDFGPPNTVEIKAVSILNSSIRHQLNSRKWEKLPLKS